MLLFGAGRPAEHQTGVYFMKKIWTVYKHTCLDNNKVYIGITSQQPASLRWGVNGRNYSLTTRFGCAIKSHGWDRFSHELLFENLTKEEACKKEIELITFYESQDKNYGYNILAGGDAPTIPDTIRQKMSKAMLGNKNGAHPCSEEAKLKISKAQIGKVVSAETRQRQSIAAKKRKRVACSEETKKKIADKHKKKKVLCTTTGEVFESVQEAGRKTGMPATAICAVCRGRHKSACQLHFEYITPMEDFNALLEDL